MSASKRVSWPDIAKGIGIIIVVLSHAFIPKLRQEFGFEFTHYFLLTIQMPLFFFVSGWLFELRADKYAQNKLGSIGNKFLRLMLPYFSFSILYYVFINIALRIDAVAPMLKMSNGGYDTYSLGESIWQILTFEGSMAKSLWFIYVLFIISALNILLPKLMRHPAAVVVLLLLPCVLRFFDPPKLIFYLIGNIGYFALGRFLFKYMDRILAMKKYAYVILTLVYVSLATVFSFANYYEVFKSENFISYFYRTISTSISVIGIIFLCVTAHYIGKSVRAAKFFTYLGQNSFVIYLIHAPILTQAVTSLMIKVFPMLPSICYCLTGLAVGIIVPLLVSKFIFEKVPILNTIFLGAPYKKKSKVK